MAEEFSVDRTEAAAMLDALVEGAGTLDGSLSGALATSGGGAS